MTSNHKRNILIQAIKGQNTQKEIYLRLNQRVIAAKNILISDFENSEITKEIEAGPLLNNSSILPNGYGNLFSFLGFNLDDKPTEPILELLQSIRLNQRPTVSNNKLIYTIQCPSIQTLFKASPMRWESGRSWIHAVTYGLTGFSYYLFNLNQRYKASRSSSAIQAKSPIRSSSTFFAGKGYLIGMLGNFKRRFE